MIELEFLNLFDWYCFFLFFFYYGISILYPRKVLYLALISRRPSE